MNVETATGGSLEERKEELKRNAFENYWDYLKGLVKVEFMEANLTDEEYSEGVEISEKIGY